MSDAESGILEIDARGAKLTTTEAPDGDMHTTGLDVALIVFGVAEGTGERLTLFSAGHANSRSSADQLITTRRFNQGFRGAHLELGPRQVFDEALIEFEALSEVTSYRHEDGPARMPSDPLRLPSIFDSPEIPAELGLSSTQVTLRPASAATLDSFLIQAKVFEDLLTMAANESCARRRMTLRAGSTNVELIAPEFVQPRSNTITPVELNFRLSSEDTQSIIDRWWAMQTSLRPALQVHVGMKYTGLSFAESHIIAAAAVAERAETHANGSVESRPGIPPAEHTALIDTLEAMPDLTEAQRNKIREWRDHGNALGFRARMRNYLDIVGEDTLRQLGVTKRQWVPVLVDARNWIAHEGSTPEVIDNGFTSRELHALYRIAETINALAIMRMLGIRDSVIDRAADRRGAYIRLNFRDLDRLVTFT